MTPRGFVLAAVAALVGGCGIILTGCDADVRRGQERVKNETPSLQAQMPRDCTITVLLRDGYSHPYHALVRCPEGITVFRF